MSVLTSWKAEQARPWGSGQWQGIAEGVLAPLHAELVQRLSTPARGVWLDLATGTGAVAMRAAPPAQTSARLTSHRSLC